MDLFFLALLCFIEAITELLPISSTAHVMFLGYFLRLDLVHLNFSLFQFIAFLPVFAYYFIPICDLIFTLDRSMFFEFFFNFIFIILPSVVVYFIFGKYLKSNLNFTLISVCMVFGGFFMLCVDKFCKNTGVDNLVCLRPRHAFVIGIFHTLAIIPGISRLATAIVASRLMKFSRPFSIDIAFLTGVPIVPGFFFYELIGNGVDAFIPSALYSKLVFFIFGILIFVVGMLMVKSIIKFLKNDGIMFFSYYRIIFGSLMFIYFRFYVN